jgi:hypothetical protein
MDAANEAIAQLQAQIAALQAHQVAAPAATAPAAPVFALSPAGIATNTFIDYSMAGGSKIFKSATDALTSKFDLDIKNLPVFMEILETRALQQGWNNTLFRVTQGRATLSLLKNYGTITDASISAKVQTYAFAATRQAQDSANLFACLRGSLEEKALKDLLSEKPKYTCIRSNVPVAPAGNADDEVYSGLTFLWRIIQQSTAQTNAMVGVLVNYLTNLKDAMMEHKSDIKEFNTNVNTKISLNYDNKHILFDEQVLLEQLFEAYGYVADAEFRKYIIRKNDEHDEGTHILMPEALMTFAYKKYQTCKQKKVWEEKSKEEQQIVNLTAQLKKSDSNFNKQSATKSKKAFSDKKSSSKGGDKSFDNKRKERFDKAPGWMKKNPGKGSRTLKKDGETYQWCAHHKLWQKHSTADCRMAQGSKAPAANTNNNKLVLDEKLAQLAYASEIEAEW